MHGRTSLLSDKSILAKIAAGDVVIDPYVPANLCTCSYDVRLGANYFRETKPQPGSPALSPRVSPALSPRVSSALSPRVSSALYNPFSADMVRQVWGSPLVAERPDGRWEGIAADEKVIWIAPGETILGHTEEYIGGRTSVTTMMKARSSMGRNFIEVCKCAGWGDVGYINRWTMEITNNSRYYTIPLVVGRRIAQIVFFDTDGVCDKSYESDGKYQQTADLEAVKRDWTPEAMLPKMYRDRETDRSS